MTNKNIHQLSREQINHLLKGGIVEVEEVGRLGVIIKTQLRIDPSELSYYNTIYRKGLETLRKEEEQ